MITERELDELFRRTIARLEGRAAMNETTAATHPDPEVRTRADGRAQGYRMAVAELTALVAASNPPQAAPTSPAGAPSVPVGASGGARPPSAPTEAPEGAPLKNVIQSPTGRVKPRLMGCNTHGCMGSVGLSTEVCDECGRVRGAPPAPR